MAKNLSQPQYLKLAKIAKHIIPMCWQIISVQGLISQSSLIIHLAVS